MHQLRISKTRVGCLIGKRGETKKVIERSTSVRLKIDSEGDVEIVGDGYGEYICEKIVRAVGRGFNPDIALNLIRDNWELEVIDIKDSVGKHKRRLAQVKARLIGSQGKSRRIIERLTCCHVSIYGKTISLIGQLDNLHVAFKGITKLLQGSPHGNVYAFLEREMKKLRNRGQ